MTTTRMSWESRSFEALRPAAVWRVPPSAFGISPRFAGGEGTVWIACGLLRA